MTERPDPKPESQFPTLREMRDRLTALVSAGLGDHPVQALHVPDSTLQAIARNEAPVALVKPALMIEFEAPEDGRLGVCIVSTDRFSGHGMNVLTQ
jgi:hypothetical protein